MATNTAETLNPPTDIVSIVESDATPFILDRKAFDGFLDQVRAEVAKAGSDVSTAKGRDAIKSAAYKVAKCKTALDNAGKDLTDEWRKKTNEVNEARRHVRETLDALKDDVRKPLTEWEQAEKARLERFQEVFNELDALASHPAPIGATSQAVADRLAEVEMDYESFDADTYGENVAALDNAKARALAAMHEAVERIRKEEADRAELERLRKEASEREAREAEAARAKAAEEERQRQEELARQREAEAAERARKEAEAEAERARQEAQAEADRRVKEAEERAAQAERDAAAKAQREQEAREAAERQKRQDDERRAANANHRAKITGEARHALTQIGLSEDDAGKVVDAIVASAVPHVSIRF